jgi:hypothetical protein
LYLWIPWSLALAWVYPIRCKKFAGYFAAGAILLIAAWCARNWAVFGDFGYNPVRSNNTLLWEAAAVQAYVDQTPPEVQRRRLFEEVSRRQAVGGGNLYTEARIERELAFSILRAHPWQTLRLYPVSVLKMLLSPGLDIVAEDLWPGASGPKVESPGYGLAGHGTFSTLKARPCLWVVLAWGLLVLAALYGLTMLSLWRLWRRRQSFAAAACLAPVAYLIIVSSGGWVYYRHRLPILPLLAVFSANAWGAVSRPPAVRTRSAS